MRPRSDKPAGPRISPEIPTFGPVSTPYWSIVMPSYLGEYSGNFGRSATNRVLKFRRAVESVLAQTESSWELVIVADGCEETWSLRNHWEDARVRFLRIPKQSLWSTIPRNTGLHRAEGRVIAYLDTDDVFLPGHLAHLREGVDAAGEGFFWAYTDDEVWDGERFVRRAAQPLGSKTARMGTSNIVHLRGIYWPPVAYRWPAMGYDHDAVFVDHLRSLAEGVYIPGGQYRVCHIPKRYDV